MNHHPVKSSHIESIAHEHGVLHVKFKSGKTYEYKDITEHQFNTMKGAESVGKHLSSLGIKGKAIN